MSAEYDPGQVFTVDGFRNRSPEFVEVNQAFLYDGSGELAT